MRRLTIAALAVSVVALGGGEARAALKKYTVRNIAFIQSPSTSPNIFHAGDVQLGKEVQEDPSLRQSLAMIDDATPGSPVLRKFRFKGNSGAITVDLSGSVGPGSFIFVNSFIDEGAGTLASKPSAFTGTGSTAGGSTIRWGNVTGWSITGKQYCNSSPPFLCEAATFQYQTTSDPFFFSDFYDLGTWFFHSTGFTASAFVHQYFTQPPGNFGNHAKVIRGFPILDATVPALPLAGVALMGGSLVVGGLVFFGRKRAD